jgi:hypothetical protein
MTYDESLSRYGLPPMDASLPAIRTLLQEEADKEACGKGGERESDLALLCCVQLFSKGLPDDALRIWNAKSAGFDLGCTIDVQLLCGAGLQQTKDYLRMSGDPSSRNALSFIEECEVAGDFEDFAPATYIAQHYSYFGV